MTSVNSPVPGINLSLSPQPPHDLRFHFRIADITRQHQGFDQPSRIVGRREPRIQVSPPHVFRRREKNAEVLTIGHEFFRFPQPFLEPLDQVIIRPLGDRELITRAANPHDHSPIFAHKRPELRIAYIQAPGQSTRNTLHDPSKILQLPGYPVHPTSSGHLGVRRDHAEVPRQTQHRRRGHIPGHQSSSDARLTTARSSCNISSSRMYGAARIVSTSRRSSSLHSCHRGILRA